MQRLRFGFIATGAIAHRLAATMRTSTTCELVAAASRSAEKAGAFADEFGIEAITGYESLLKRNDLDAVYVATPHPQHHEWCLRAIEQGKHVLCEKPFTMRLAELEEIIAAARKRGVLVVEAFMYRFYPQTRRLVELISAGKIGEVRAIQADFGFNAEASASSRLIAKKLGGGGILDVGCYTVSMARLIAGAAASISGKAFADPISLQGTALLHPTEGTDWFSSALLKFPGQLLATVRCATGLEIGQRVIVDGSKGRLELAHPWFFDDKESFIRHVTEEGESAIPIVASSADPYSYMLDEFAACVRAGQHESAIMSLDDSLGNMRALEEWYRQVGVEY